MAFDESDPEEHQIKILFGCGVYFGLRGNIEHCDLDVRNITHGTFPSQHSFGGYKYYGIDCLMYKTHKLTYNTDYVRQTTNVMRVPKTNDDPRSNCLGGSIERFLNKLAPRQLKLYCKVIPENSDTQIKMV